MTTIIPVVPREKAPDADGRYFDGETARAHPVTLRIDETTEALHISGEDVSQSWPLGVIRLVPDQAGVKGLVLRRGDDPLARLFTKDRVLAQRFPALKKRTTDIKRSHLMAWAFGAVASVALIILVLVPLMADQLAEFIPPEGEQALGETTLDSIRSALDQSGLRPLPFCEAPEGMAALRKMQQKLSRATDLPVPLKVHVLDHEMINAFALPGGHVVFMRGLIEQAESAEEVAAVFAHEIGHVVSRDPTRHALRSAGSIGVLGLLFGDFAGGALVLFLTEQLIAAQYSQQAETDADTFAYGVLQDSGIAPSAIADMFERMLQAYGDAQGVKSHFLSHPRMSERIEAAHAATPRDFRHVDILTPSEWRALQTICDR
ncbi:M48 family metallopeptidase [Shimia sediminis]|uniref:M48 family metallopeptidase n=1 Tax=Shimia sediminis TaxID=2497945 RepID=UPI000F8E4D73|nr:M48 family metallopeptidase [Shimia sediminis]